ncbi:MAG: hypothetical protein HYR73_08135 [Candidatus Eisenbacteria bacterium]|nr:hypothetical protein [Candidatus Eisenbacteria bacterium]
MNLRLAANRSRALERSGQGLLLAAMLACGCERLPTRPAVVSANQVHGVTLVDWTAGGYASASSTNAIDALAQIHANSMAIVITAYQTDRGANEVRSDGPRTPSRAAVRQAIARAQALGLDVALKLHIDLDDGSWRGFIAPTDPVAWFASYQRFMLPWATFAETTGVREFVIGTELASTLGEAERWRETIRMARSAFPGELLYAASWDEAARVPFWRDLDGVGIDFYFPVAKRADPGRFEVLAAWQPILDRLNVLHRQTGKNILLTEIGYRSVAGAGMQPYQGGTSGTLDLAEQGDLYWAALQATADKSWIRGMYWWNWPADGSGGPLNTDYTPRGKTASQELAAAWGQVALAGRPRE